MVYLSEDDVYLLSEDVATFQSDNDSSSVYYAVISESHAVLLD